MPKLIVEEQKDYPTLPTDSIIHVKVDRLEVRTVNGPRGDWEKLEFKFKILGIQSTPGDHPSNYDLLIGEQIFGSTPFRITDSQENKLRLWAESLLNRPLPVGFELDTDYLLGRECRATTSQYDKRAINPVTKVPFKQHQVESLLPLGQASAPQQYQQQPVQQAPGGWAGSQPQIQPQTQQQPDPWQSQQPVPAGTPDPWAPLGGGDEPPF